MDETGPRKRGGQPKPAADRKRNNLTFRARDDLKARLEATAAEHQRSVSEEIEHRLERSFEWETAFGDARSMLANAKSVTAKGSLANLQEQGLLVKVTTSLGTVWLEPGTDPAAAGKVSPEPHIQSAVVLALRETLKPDLLQPVKGASDEGEYNPPRD